MFKILPPHNPKEMEDGIWYHTNNVVGLQCVAFVAGFFVGMSVMLFWDILT